MMDDEAGQLSMLLAFRAENTYSFYDELDFSLEATAQAFNEYWCMFDVDEFPNLPETYQLAAQHDIKIAVSNPCVELWFLLHFQDQTAALERGPAQTLAKRYLSCGKSLTPDALDQLVQHHGVAMERAEKLDNKHEGDGSPACSNPSSSVWRLVERIRNQ
ncbi:RloB family protein [Nonomuraea rubra]